MEDVQYMMEHGSKQEQLLRVDSSNRDRIAFKTPSTYQVNFSVPFCNVYGIDVFDTYIPRTQYLVSSNSNTLAFNVDGEGWQEFEVDPSDYNIQQLVDTLQVGLTCNNKSISVTSVSTPIDVRSQLKFVSNYPFKLNMSVSSMRNILGFANPIIQSESPANYDYPVGYADGDPDIFVANVDSSNVQLTTAFTGPTPITDNIPITAGAPVTQLFQAAMTGNIVQVSASFAQIGAPISPTVQFQVTDATSGAIAASGNLNVIVDSFNSATICNQVSVQQDLVIHHNYALSLSTNMADAGNTWGVFYQEPSLPSTQVLPIYVGQQQQINSGNATPFQNNPDLQLSGTVVQGGVQYRINAPGLYNLTGDSYILIRCQELEDHLLGAQAFDPAYSMGLAKVQMGIFGYGNNNYDYSNYSSRTFHPIAKLTKMTLRFEQTDGSLYDFLGVDHVMTFKLRFYVSPHKQLNTYLINPSYNPDLRQWQEEEAKRKRHNDWLRERAALADKVRQHPNGM